MALSTAIFVGETKEWIPEIVEKARQLKVNAGIYDYKTLIIHYRVIFI